MPKLIMKEYCLSTQYLRYFQFAWILLVMILVNCTFKSSVSVLVLYASPKMYMTEKKIF